MLSCEETGYGENGWCTLRFAGLLQRIYKILSAFRGWNWFVLHVSSLRIRGHLDIVIASGGRCWWWVWCCDRGRWLMSFSSLWNASWPAMVVILVGVGLTESKALSVSGDHAFETAKILLCFFVWPTMSILQRIWNPVCCCDWFRVVLSFRDYDSCSQSLFWWIPGSARGILPPSFGSDIWSCPGESTGVWSSLVCHPCCGGWWWDLCIAFHISWKM